MLERRELWQEQRKESLELVAVLIDAYDDGETGDDLACWKSV